MKNLWRKFSPETATYYPFPDRKEIYWILRAPTFKDEFVMSRFVSEVNRVTPEITAMEIALTFSETTFPGVDSASEIPGTDGFIPALEKGASVEAVQAYLETLPQPLVFEIWQAVAEVAPNWGPSIKSRNKRGTIQPIEV